MPGLAVEEVLADQRLRPRLAEDVGRAGRRSPSRSISMPTQRAVCRRGRARSVVDLARADAGDLHVGALDEPERVVELDRVVACRRRRRRPRRSRRRRPRRRAPRPTDGERCASWARRDLGRVAVEVRRRTGSSRRGRALDRARAAVVLAARGDLRRRPASRSVRRARGCSRPLTNAKALTVVRAAAGRAVGVVDAGVAEVVEPAGEVDGVGAEEGEVRRLRSAATRSRSANEPGRSSPLRCDRADRDVAERQRRVRELDQVVVLAAAAHERRRGRGRSARASRANGRSSASTRAQLRRDRLATRRPAGRGRRASRAGSRTSCWRGA